LAERREDIAPNLDYLLSRLTEQRGSVRAQQTRFTSEARASYLRFAMSDAAHWGGNFRDLGASVTRLATLAEAGRITETGVVEEIARLRQQWQAPRAVLAETPDAPDLTDWLTEPQLAALDLFDRVQLEAVIRICRQSRNQAAAGRTLFAASRAAKQTVNDSDRLRKYLAKFGLSYEAVANAQ
jgi:transcriptional regulatory protein RtcR